MVLGLTPAGVFEHALANVMEQAVGMHHTSLITLVQGTDAH
jgi:hypothetical protein